MKILFYIFILFFASTQITKSQDSIANTKFNYLEFNVNSANYIYSSYLKLKSFNSINVGIKSGHHKLSIGLEINSVFIEPNNAILYEYAVKNINIYKPNFKANYYFYFSKKQKKVNQFLMLNFNSQTVKDYYTNQLTDYEYKTGYAYGFGYGATFYIKKSFIIEPSILVNTMFFTNKDVYKNVTYLTTSYTEVNNSYYVFYSGLGLKLGYIINFKNKTK